MVGVGILLSRILGLVRNRLFAHYFGTSAVADAFGAAFKIPNFLQNLFGEGVLSASFIPVYARLLAEQDREEAQRVAGAVLSLLALVTAVLVALGVLLTPQMIDLIAPGFHGEKRLLTIRLVRILFPGTGLLVISAWCLGILNSHRRFLLSYAAPVVWNLAIIGTLLWRGGTVPQERLAVIAAWGSVAGSALQVLVQMPTVLRLLGALRPSLAVRQPGVRTVVKNFGPVFVGRGVVQISAYVDTVLASLLGDGPVAALSYAQALYVLPVSLFGMSVSAAELPAMSSATGTGAEVASYLRTRLDAGLRQIAFYVVPSAAMFLALGDVVAGALYQSGRFSRADSLYAWAILAGSAVGLLASTMGRLYASTYYALRDTRTPLRFGVLRVILTTGLGYLAAVPLPPLLGLPLAWGAAGLTATAGIAGWVEFVLLRRELNRRIGQTGLDTTYTLRLWGASIIAAAVGWAVKLGVAAVAPAGALHHPTIQAIFILGAFGVTYLGVTSALNLPQARQITGRLRRRPASAAGA
jgi:putative peptidoglycan lipid II flippase